MENLQVKNLLSALKKVSADLPQEVQTALQKMQSDDSRQLTKQLHSAVSQLGNSKKALADLTSARSNLHQSWNAFLESAIGRWERYAEEFTQQDRDLASQIEKAKETMKICKDHFKSLQALEGAASETTAEVISDDEENSLPSKVDVHMKQMQESLKLLKGGMEEELRGSKRQRLEDTTEPAGGLASAGAGRQVSDSPIACRPASKQWLLNAIHLNDFVAPWEAQDRAADLAWELGSLPHADFRFPVSDAPIPHRKYKKVSFNDMVTLRMTTEMLETTYEIPDGLLSTWHCKPWTLACNALDEEWSVYDDDVTHFMQYSINVQTQPYDGQQCTGPESILSDEVKEKMSLHRSTLATCPFVSYGLLETGVGTRTFLLRELSHDGLLLQLREEWEEYSDSNMKVHWVWPQPQGDTPGFHIIVEFLPGDELPHPSIVPALEETTILSIHGRPDVQRTALYHQRRLHYVDITRPFYDVCHRAQYVCVIRVLGKILPLSWARNIFAGALVQLFAHPPSLQVMQEYEDYFDRMQPFFSDSLVMWAELHLPTTINHGR